MEKKYEENKKVLEYDNKYVNSKFSYFYGVDYAHTQLMEIGQFVIYSVVSFTLPFMFSHPQILLGSIVNMLLVLGAQNVKGHKLWALIILPNLGVLASGALFGALSKFLIFFIPSIWIGNALIVFGYKYFKFGKNKNTAQSLSYSIALKVVFMSVYAFILVSLHLVPNVFLMAMSVLQLGTAILGGICAVGISKYVLSKFTL